MKYLSLLSFIGILLFASCNEELDSEVNAVIINDKKISAITLDGRGFERFYYDENENLREVQIDYTAYDPVTGEQGTVISSREFQYDTEGKLDFVILSNADTVDISYSQDNLIVSGFHHQYDEAYMLYSKYNAYGQMGVTMVNELPINHCFLTANYDSENNFISAEKITGEILEDGCPGFYYLSQYYGEYTYNTFRHPYSTLPIEAQFYLYQKPFVNCVSSIQRSNKRIEYLYEYDEDGYPLTSEAMTIFPSGPDTIFHGVKTYIYE